MKDKDDLVRGWLKKAASDIKAMKASISVEAFDTACFHSQQAAEKMLKALLTYWSVEFPFTHNLSKLVELCAEKDESFVELLDVVEPLTPYAVELRYDVDFWPEIDTADDAAKSVDTLARFIIEKLPDDISSALGELK